MLIENVRKSSLPVLQYMERYVNDGSPSGFTEKNTTSPETDPFGLSPWFHLAICRGNANFFKDFGRIPEYEIGAGNNWILLHPDMQSKLLELQSNELDISVLENWKVIPTSSGRTVQIKKNDNHNYIKLHYDGIIGRVNRALPWSKAIAGIEINSEILNGINSRKLDYRLSLMQEVGARVLFVSTGDNTSQWGMIWREAEPYGPSSSKISCLIPYFSMFSVDRFSSFEHPLLTQLISLFRHPPLEFVLETIVSPVLLSYFSLVSQLGLQAEWNAQNLLLGLDENLNIVSVVMRDLGEIEKDFTLREKLGLPNDFASYPYKCISQENDNYKIRHSFQFDFKVGEYLLEPLGELLENNFGVNRKLYYNEVRKISRALIRGLPEDYFPADGKWYKHERIMLTGSRPYVASENPKFR